MLIMSLFRSVNKWPEKQNNENLPTDTEQGGYSLAWGSTDARSHFFDDFQLSYLLFLNLPLFSIYVWRSDCKQKKTFYYWNLKV